VSNAGGLYRRLVKWSIQIRGISIFSPNYSWEGSTLCIFGKEANLVINSVNFNLLLLMTMGMIIIFKTQVVIQLLEMFMFWFNYGFEELGIMGI
jgi:hypothetical protein